MITGAPLLIVGEALVIRIGDGPPFPSGAPAIAAWVAARLGTATAFAGAVGADDGGELIRASLAGAGVDTAAVVTRPGLPTARARVDYAADGSRRFEFAVRESAAPSFTDADLGDLPERAGWVHVSGSALLFGGPLGAATASAVRRGKAAGAVVSIDPNLRPELADPAVEPLLRGLCRAADVLFPSDDELEQLGLDEDELVAAGVVVCRTLAADGARLRTATVDRSFPAIAEASDVLDPDGAGDTFAGAVVAGRLRGLDWPDAMAAAGRVVARAIAVAGPMTVELGPADLAP